VQRTAHCFFIHVIFSGVDQAIANELTAAGKSLYEDGKQLQDNAEKALSKATMAERTERITIRVESSLLNPSKVLTNLWESLSKEFPKYKFSIIPYEDKKEQIIQVISSLRDRMESI